MIFKLFDLIFLFNFILDNNDFVGPIPTEISGATSLEYFISGKCDFVLRRIHTYFVDSDLTTSSFGLLCQEEINSLEPFRASLDCCRT